MRIATLGTIATLTAMFAGLAVAQVTPGNFDSPASFVAQNVRSQEMGQCAVRHDESHAVALVMSEAGSPDQRSAIAKLMPALTKCLSGSRSATLDPSYLRGGVAEALLKNNDGALLKQAARMAPAPAARIASLDVPEPNVALMSCVAKAQPAGVAAMLLSPAGSLADAAAFRALSLSLQACVPIQGEVHLAAARVRPTAAIALYRLEAAQ